MTPVENAVKHGVAQAPGAVRVRVRAWRDDVRLHLEVIDEGCVAGASPVPPPDGLGLGLANARERLSAHYGAAASITLAQDAAATRLRIELPASDATAPDRSAA